MSRLPSGGLIDRSRPLSFTFDGKRYGGFEGDTLASALIANDVRLVGRSFKYHRPRGLLTAGGEEPNGIVTLRSGAYAEPNTRATTAWLYEGLEATSQNRWPSLAFDVMAINQLFSPIFVAGFYYKTFMWPATFWEKLYEPLIRRAAGLGALSGLPDPDTYARTHASCDVLVIGGGPAGLAAALVAGRSGRKVIIASDDARLGGSLLSEQKQIDKQSAEKWACAAEAELISLANVTVLPRTLVFGVYDDREYGAIERLTDHLPSCEGRPRQRLWKIAAKHAILATGAIERPLVFGGNDRPGVMMASAISTYVNRFAASPGKRATIFTTTYSGWQTAADLMNAGVHVAAVIDPRPVLPANAHALSDAGVECLPGAVIRDVQGRHVRGIKVELADGRTRRIETDLVGMSGGWNPAIGIASNLGARPVWSEELSAFIVDRSPAGMQPVGSAAGRYGLGDALRGGAQIAARALEALGAPLPSLPSWAVAEDDIEMRPLWRVESSRTTAFVDFQHDVTVSDVALAAREGFVSVEHLKRYTTLGMATDQGKTSQVNGHALLAAATGKSIAEAGTIMSRPPYLPVTIAAFAGHNRQSTYRPRRLTAAHDWAAMRGASFVDSGLWRRARWFAQPGERDWTETVYREATTVRTGVGVCDVSTLGKIEVHGPDAGALLDRLYINTVSTLPIGRTRYGVMLREDGIVLDDGTVTRLGEARYYLTTTTANAAKVMQHIDFVRQVIWPDLDVQAASVTEQWATYAVAGPTSREVLQATFPGIDLSDAALPFMGARELRWRDHPLRIFRVSLSGERAYEVSIVAAKGEALIQAIFQAGEPYRIIPYGTEAQNLLRIEKGHAAGNELNGQTTAADLGLRRMMSMKKDFIGRRLSERPGMADVNRPTLVGIKPGADGVRLPAGAHLMPEHGDPTPARGQGWISSSTYSPSLGHWIAIAFVRNGPQRLGERLRLYDPLRGNSGIAEICSPVFVDPEGVRGRG